MNVGREPPFVHGRGGQSGCRGSIVCCFGEPCSGGVEPDHRVRVFSKCRELERPGPSFSPIGRKWYLRLSFQSDSVAHNQCVLITSLDGIPDLRALKGRIVKKKSA